MIRSRRMGFAWNEYFCRLSFVDSHKVNNSFHPININAGKFRRTSSVFIQLHKTTVNSKCKRHSLDISLLNFDSLQLELLIIVIILISDIIINVCNEIWTTGNAKKSVDLALHFCCSWFHSNLEEKIIRYFCLYLYWTANNHGYQSYNVCLSLHVDWYGSVNVCIFSIFGACSCYVHGNC